MSTETKGRCLCGAVIVTVEGPLGDIWACHCDMCRRWSGSVQMGIDIPRERVTVEGPVKTFRSSPFAERAWCDTCGSSLWFADVKGANSGIVELAPGLFDNFGGARLAKVSYADQGPEGLSFAGDLKRVTKAEYEERNQHVEDEA